MGSSDMNHEDVSYERDGAVAIITIDRPQVLNAFRNQTVTELVDAFRTAWADSAVGAVILTGAGDRAFCAGGDQSARTDRGYGDALRAEIGSDIEDLHSVIRDIPKPVIAAVNGYAIGGGHVLHVMCDMTIAAEHAVFGQAGPTVGSFDAGFGTGYLAAVIGEKRAREMWFRCRRYSAEEALAIGLVNAVVPADQLMAEATAWAAEMAAYSPTALRMLKQSFNVATESLRPVSALSMSALALFYRSEESQEGRDAFLEKRRPDFAAFRGAPAPRSKAGEEAT